MAAHPLPSAEDVAEVFADLTMFCELLEIPTKGDDGDGIVRFSYDRWWDEQRRFERDRTGFDVILKPRQIGFSTLELARDVQYARTHRGVQVLVVVHHDEAKAELFHRVKIMEQALRRIGASPKPVTSTKTEVRWPDNHSVVRIISAGNTEDTADARGRSGTIHRLHATEVAYWNEAAITLSALRKAVPKSGEVVIESTANGVGGVFHALVEQSGKGVGPYKLHFYPWFEHDEYRADPRPGLFDRVYPDDERVWIDFYVAKGLDDSQLQWWVNQVDEARATGGLDAVLKDYPPTVEAAFRTGDDQWVDVWACDVLAMRVAKPLRTHRLVTDTGRDLGELRIFEEPVRGQGYIVGADVSEGVGGDDSAATVMHHRTGRVAAAFNSDSIEPGDFGLALAIIGRLYSNALVAPERNKDGSAVLRSLRAEAGYRNIYTHEDEREGWPTTPETRPILFDDLRTAIIDSAQAVRDAGDTSLAHTWTPDAETVAQCRSITRGKNGKPAARGKGKQGGAKDDLFVSWAIARQVRQRMPLPSTAEPPRIQNGRRTQARKLGSIL